MEGSHLRISEIIPELKNNPSAFKMHMAVTHHDDNPLHRYFRNEFKQWQEEQTKRNFERQFVLSLIQLRVDQWLYAGIYEVHGHSFDPVRNLFVYNTSQTNLRSELIGRLVLRFPKNFRASYLLFENHQNELMVSEITRERLSIEPFPGYENVSLDFNMLRTIINNEDVSWKTALCNAKGIYLITDKSNGKQYVGSVCGQEAFWSRWSAYVKTGHGYNVDLVALLNENGVAHPENFHFSILEIRSNTTDPEEILKREVHWKRILFTREFGYNKN